MNDRPEQSGSGPAGLCRSCDRRRSTDDLGPEAICPSCQTAPQPHRARHGLTAALDGCICETCLDALDTAREMVARRNDGETLQAIGNDHGVSREAVRLITEQTAPHKPWQAIRREAQAVQAEVNAAALTVDCDVCGTAFRRDVGQKRRCSSRCRRVYELLRYHVDEDYRRRQRHAAAAWTLRSVDDAQRRRYARRLLDGRHDPRERWTVPGSAAHAAALEAVASGWPIADRLPDTLREQLSRQAA